MPKTFRAFVIVVVAATLAGCLGADDRFVDLESQEQTLDLLDQEGLLAFVNDGTRVTLELLDVGCGIRADSAANIVAYRDGRDGSPGTADDNSFDDLDELRRIHMVGPWTLEQLYLCANDRGYLFAREEGFMDFLNDPATSLAMLDLACAIRSDSAANILDHRNGPDGVPGTADDDPFGSVRELDDVYMVGLWTLERLYACAGGYGYLDDDSIGPEVGDEQVTIVYDLGGLDPELRAKIEGELAERAEELSDHDVVFGVRFAEVEVVTVDSVPVRYVVRFVQTIDPEGGIQIWIVFNLNADLHVTDTDVYI